MSVVTFRVRIEALDTELFALLRPLHPCLTLPIAQGKSRPNRYPTRGPRVWKLSY